MTESKRPDLLVFDCDPGCDDALAIALVLKAEAYAQVDILSVAGNVGVDLTTANAQRIVDIVRTEDSLPRTAIRIFRGCRRSLAGGELPASNVHGRDGLGDVPASFVRARTVSPARVEERHAVAHLVDLAQKGCAFDLLCTGPLTNLATALSVMDASVQDAFWCSARHVVFMGGQFQVAGNITPAAEFNIFHDPVAAQIVLDSWLETAERRRRAKRDVPKRVCFVPLDATEKVVLELSEKGGPAASTGLGRFLRSALIAYGRFHAIACRNPDMNESDYRQRDWEVFRDHLTGGSGVKFWRPFCHVHDALAAWALLKSDSPGDSDCAIFDWQSMEIRVETSRGEARGHIFDAGQQAQPFSSLAVSIGTPVLWLQTIRDQTESKVKVLNGKSDLLDQLLALFARPRSSEAIGRHGQHHKTHQ